MIPHIFSFELKYRFKSPLTYLILFILAGQGIWYAYGVYDFYTSDEALMNGAGIFYQCLAGGGMILVAIVAMISGTTLYRDIAVGSANYVYACPLQEKRFFLSHFAVAYCINLLLVAAYPLGMVLIRYSGFGEPHLFGPTHWAQLFHGYLIFCVPNLFLLTTICFFSLVYARRMSAAYIGVTAVIILFCISEVMSDNSPHRFFLEVLDPFGYVYTKLAVHELPVAMKNSAFLPLTASFWVNRLLWLSFSLVALFLAFRKFSFHYFIQRPASGMRFGKTDQAGENGVQSLTGMGEIPTVGCHFTVRENIAKVLRMAVTEFLTVVRPTSFRIIFGILVFIVLMQDMFWNSTYYIGHQMPLTSGMCNVRLVNGFVFMIILMLYSGELFFKERTTGFWQITGATPSPAWVLQIPKLLAMFATAFLFALAIFLGGVLTQLLHGFFDINLGLYIGDVFGYRFGWLTYVLNIVLVFFLASLLGNRYLTHIVAVGYYIFMIVSFDVGLIEQLRFGYALTPGVDDYSEIMGYGIWGQSSFWFFVMWAVLALFFILAALQFWRRGTGQRIIDRKRIFGGELSPRAKAVGLSALLLFFFLQHFVLLKSNGLRNYIPSDQADMESAEYEQQYRDLAETNHFSQELYELRIDLYPEERRAEYAATLAIINLSEQPVDRLYLNMDSHGGIQTLTLNHEPLELLQRNRELGMAVYALPVPLGERERAMLYIEAFRQYQGFPQTSDEPQADLATNGLFFTEAIPFIGFDQDKTLLDNRDRILYKLPKLESRLASVNDSCSLQRGFVSVGEIPDETRKVNITVSTSALQQPFAPGKLVRSWHEGSRNYSYYQIESATMVQPYIGSGRFDVRQSRLEGVDVTLLHHPGHDYNLEEFDAGIREGLAFITQYLGAYPYPQLRIAEIPWYQEDSYAMAGAIALSEKEGWYADCGVDEIRGYIQFVLARDLIRQWVAANGSIADVQGADMLWTALPSALALQVVKSRIGEEQVEALFVKMRKTYRKDRTNEPNREPSLIFADQIDYLEPNKGTMALYRLAESIGRENFNKTVSRWVTNTTGKLVFLDLYEALKADYDITPELRALFEEVEEHPLL